MPFYDFACPGCDWKGDKLVPIGTIIDCPTCGTKTEKVWSTHASGVQDDGVPGGIWLENGVHEPVRFDSYSERSRYMKEHGLMEMVRHVGLKGSDKNPHTVRWVSAPVVTEEERLKQWHESDPELSRIAKAIEEESKAN